MLEIENSRYRAELNPISYGRGRLSFFYKDTLKIRGSKVEPDAYIDHSYSVLEGVFKGKFPFVSNAKHGIRREICQRFLKFTGVDKIPQNLSYILLNEFPVFFTCPDFNNGFIPIRKDDLELFFRGKEASLASRKVNIKLSREEEFELFRSFNYHKKRMLENCTEILESDSKSKGFKHEVIDLLDSYKESLFFTDAFVRVNSRIVYSIIIRKSLNMQPDLINLGFIALRNSAIRFDFNRGYKFSTYACSAIIKELYRHRKNEKKGQYQELKDYHQDDISVNDSRDEDKEYQAELVKDIFQGNAAELNENEKKVIKYRFGFSVNPRTLEHIGREIGVSRERVRQIQKKSITKLRNAFVEELEAID